MQSPQLDLEKVLADPEVLTGLSLRKYREARLSFPGTDISFLTIAIWSYTGLAQGFLGHLLGRHQPNISRSLTNGRNDFIAAYKSAVGREPRRPLIEIYDTDNLLKRLPAAAEYFRNEYIAA